MKSILEQIAQARRQDIERLKVEMPLPEIMKHMRDKPAGNFRKALADRESVNIIAEIKKASPSRGVLVSDFNPVLLARKYRDGGAAALSVLTEERHFLGRPEYMQMARTETNLPILCKDFIIDSYQVYHARVMGASAILLIVAMHNVDVLREFIKLAGEAGLDCLVEVHDESELTKALDAGADIIGVNNRNLRDFTVNLETSEYLAPKLPDGVLRVAESGIFGRDEVIRLQLAGYNNFLIGEALVRSSDPAALIREMRAE